MQIHAHVDNYNYSLWTRDILSTDLFICFDILYLLMLYLDMTVVYSYNAGLSGMIKIAQCIQMSQQSHV